MLILDTNAWLWWMHNPKKLSQEAQEHINKEEANKALRVSAISVWEVAVKVGTGKLKIPMEINAWYKKASSHQSITIEALNPLDAIASTQLPGNFHKDPADRIIVAVARRYGVPLITSNEKILQYSHIQTIW